MLVMPATDAYHGQELIHIENFEWETYYMYVI